MSSLNHFTGCVENTQLTPELLRKERNEMYRRARFNVTKDHRFWQLPSAQLQAIVYGSPHRSK